jgi:hypothetical protein
MRKVAEAIHYRVAENARETALSPLDELDTARQQELEDIRSYYRVLKKAGAVRNESKRKRGLLCFFF